MHLLLLLLAASIGYGIWAYTHPYRPCPWCKGKGSNRGSTRRRSGRCRRCGGSKQVKSIGSRMLHRAIRGAARFNRDRKGK